MQLSYRLERGFHYWVCIACGERGKELIPDQADDRYRNNPGNPLLAVCPNCNHGKGTGEIQQGPSTPPAQKALDDEGKAELPDGEWGEYWKLAERYSQRAILDDREDLRDTIMVTLFEVGKRREAQAKPFSNLAKLRTASYARKGFYRDKKRLGRIVSLNVKVPNDEGEETELLDTLADDKALDLNAWLDARYWLLNCPATLARIALKRAKGIPLTKYEQLYLCRFWKRQQKRLPA